MRSVRSDRTYAEVAALVPRAVPPSGPAQAPASPALGGGARARAASPQRPASTKRDTLTAGLHATTAHSDKRPKVYSEKPAPTPPSKSVRPGVSLTAMKRPRLENKSSSDPVVAQADEAKSRYVRVSGGCCCVGVSGGQASMCMCGCMPVIACLSCPCPGSWAPTFSLVATPGQNPLGCPVSPRLFFPSRPWLPPCTRYWRHHRPWEPVILSWMQLHYWTNSCRAARQAHSPVLPGACPSQTPTCWPRQAVGSCVWVTTSGTFLSGHSHRPS